VHEVLEKVLVALRDLGVREGSRRRRRGGMEGGGAGGACREGWREGGGGLKIKLYFSTRKSLRNHTICISKNSLES
jgi:hypothetical protein